MDMEYKAPEKQVVQLDGTRISGLFSTQEIIKVGTGTTQRKTIHKAYWYVDENENGEITAQPLNNNYVPSGPKNPVDRNDLLEKYSPEPEFYQSTVYPKLKELDDTIVRGEANRARGANYSAEFEFKQAAEIDEENVRANFGLGLTYLDRGDTAKADDMFKRLLELDAAFDEEHKHLFNDFGINMRKNKMFDQALDYYLKAEGLVDDDEHLFHNIARLYFDQGKMDKCVQYLKRSHLLNPDLEETNQFIEYMKKNGHMKDED